MKYIRSVPCMSYVLVLCLIHCAPGLAEDLTKEMAREVVEKTRDATVAVLVEYGDAEYNQYSYGTGFIVGDGQVITSAHVVNKKAIRNIYIFNHILPRTKAELTVVDQGHFRYEINERLIEYAANAIIATGYLNNLEITLSSRQNQNDLALLRFDRPESIVLNPLIFELNYNYFDAIVSFGYSSQIPNQETSYLTSRFTIRKPTPATPMMITCGEISSIIPGEIIRVINTAPSSAGMSGGPLINQTGNVIGINTMIFTGGEIESASSIAISSDDIVRFLRENGVNPLLSGEKTARRAFLLPQENNDADTREGLLALANGGNVEAQALVGLLHYLGEVGFSKDPVEAIKWLEFSLLTKAKRLNAERYIQGGLAAIYLYDATHRSAKRAMELLQEANCSNVFDPDVIKENADFNLLALEAYMYYQGERYGIAYDEGRSRHLAMIGAEAGNENCIALLGFHHYFGSEVYPRDRFTALKCAFETANNGFAQGTSLLAHLYYDSEIVEENRDLVLSLAREAAESGDVWAMGLLCDYSFFTEGDVDIPNLDQYINTALNAKNRLALFVNGMGYWNQYLDTENFGSAIAAWAFAALAESRGVDTEAFTPDKDMPFSSYILDRFDQAERMELLIIGRKIQEELKTSLEQPKE